MIEMDYLPEVSLVGAVLERAVLDICGHSAKPHERRSAKRWIRKEYQEGRAPEFSFEWVCHQLGLCAATVRNSIWRYQELRLSVQPLRSAHRARVSRIGDMVLSHRIPEDACGANLGGWR